MRIIFSVSNCWILLLKCWQWGQKLKEEEVEEIPSGFFKPHSTWIPWQKIIVDCQFNRIVGFLVVVWKEANFLRQARRLHNVWTPYMRVLAFITSALTTTTDCPIYTRSDISSNSKGVLARIWHIKSDRASIRTVAIVGFVGQSYTIISDMPQLCHTMTWHLAKR